MIELCGCGKCGLPVRKECHKFIHGHSGVLNKGRSRPDVIELNKKRIGWKHTEDELNRQSEAQRGKKNPGQSERMRQKIGENHPKFGKKDPAASERMKARIGEKNPIFGRTGENSPNWHGGISSYPYGVGFNKELKNHIREKFNHTCILCSITEEEAGRKHIPHHIDYDKKNNEEENFVLLCIGDNSKVNANRGFWETQFRILNGVYDPKFLGL
jgi:hypothetical protein